GLVGGERLLLARKRERSESAKETKQREEARASAALILPISIPFAFSLLSRFRVKKVETPDGVSSGPAEALLRRVLYWTGGHPYLTQRLCRAVAEANAPNPKSKIRNPKSVDRQCEELF